VLIDWRFFTIIIATSTFIWSTAAQANSHIGRDWHAAIFYFSSGHSVTSESVTYNVPINPVLSVVASETVSPQTKAAEAQRGSHLTSTAKIAALLSGSLSGQAMLTRAAAVFLKATPLTRFRAPNGEFSIALPEGWHIEGTSANGQSDGEVKIYAPDDRADAFIFPLLSLTNLYVETTGVVPQYRQCMVMQGVLPCAQAVVRRLASFTTRQYSAGQALDLLLTKLQRAGAIVRNIHVHVLSAGELEGQSVITVQHKTLSEWFLLRMLEVPNPLFPQPGHVESFVFLRGCEAPVGQLGPAQLKPCAAILGSFRPNPSWVNTPVNRVIEFYRLMGQQIQNRLMANSVFQFGEQSLAQFHQTENTIANWGNQMRQMQMQQFAQNMASNYKITAGWMNALTGRRDIYTQSGQEYNVNTNFQNYQHYCVSSAGVTGFNGLGSCGPYATPAK
jgi:hypothetical protein